MAVSKSMKIREIAFELMKINSQSMLGHKDGLVTLFVVPGTTKEMLHYPSNCSIRGKGNIGSGKCSILYDYSGIEFEIPVYYLAY